MSDERLRWNEPFKRSAPPWWFWVLLAVLGSIGSALGSLIAFSALTPKLEVTCQFIAPPLKNEPRIEMEPLIITPDHSGEL